nr:glycosyltransferase family 39 protein [Sulfitobacter algicola]
MAFGYYSKPPMIGWVIRAFTEIGGSDTAFWIRLPAPLLHAATALILGAIAARHIGHRAAIATALGYATLPMVAVGSFLISTDTVMFPFLAGALYCYLRIFEDDRRQWLILTGVLLGFAFLSKYAALYYVIMACLTAVAFRQYRPNWGQTGTILGVFLITISPNILWNIANGLSTIEHTLDNADWVRDPGSRASLNFAGLTEFFLAQFAVFGPVVFGWLLVLGWRAARGGLTLFQAAMLLFSLPIIVLVCLQAILSEAYANWAAAAYVAGSLVVFSALVTRPNWLKASFVINGFLCLFLPIAMIFADRMTLGQDRLLMSRYVGLDELSDQIFDVAARNDQTTIVARKRDILADLFYTGRDKPFDIAAAPHKGRAPNHYALSYSFQPNPDQPTVLYVIESKRSLPCDGTKVADIISDAGKYRDEPYSAYIVPNTCWN